MTASVRLATRFRGLLAASTASAGVLLAACILPAGPDFQPRSDSPREPPPVSAAPPLPAPTTAPNLEELREGSYSGILAETVRLREGRYEGPPFVEGGAARPQVELLDDLVARGDVDGDGVPEAVVLLSESSGGSGTRTYVSVVKTAGRTAESVATALVGDRVQVMDLAVEGGLIHLDAVVAGPGDALCCPTQKARKTYALTGSQLDQSLEWRGAVSLADLGGQVWVLEGPAGGAAADAPRITAEFDGGRVSGSAGCNLYSASIGADEGEGVSVGPVAATRRACAPEVMRDEQTYLARLSGTTRFGFVAGRLVLSYREGQGFGTLLFARELPAVSAAAEPASTPAPTDTEAP